MRIKLSSSKFSTRVTIIPHFHDIHKYNEEEKSKQVSDNFIVARQMTAIKFNDISCASNYTFPPHGLSSSHSCIQLCECQVAAYILSANILSYK